MTLQERAEQYAEMNHDPAIFMDKQQIKAAFLAGANGVWVSVDDCLPDGPYNVMVYGNLVRTDGYYFEGKWRGFDEYVYPVTHWMEYPKPPSKPMI